MKRALLIAMLGALSIHTFVEAQQGGVNTSVLPPRFNPPPATITPDEFVRTDAIGQKQMEGAIAASTRAWDVLFAVFNDYRWVQAGDFLTGETTNGGGIMSNLLAWLFHRPRKPAVRPVSAAAPAEAWIGGATSNDGGATWSGVFVPGGPFDNSPPSLASPVKALNFESGTDPWIVSAPCGFFHVVWVPFTRFQDSAVAVATYQHMNDADGRRTIRYRYSSIVQYVHNAANGPFLDLPNMAIQPDQSSSDPCSTTSMSPTWPSTASISLRSRASRARATAARHGRRHRFRRSPRRISAPSSRSILATAPSISRFAPSPTAHRPTTRCGSRGRSMAGRASTSRC